MCEFVQEYNVGLIFTVCVICFGLGMFLWCIVERAASTSTRAFTRKQERLAALHWAAIVTATERDDMGWLRSYRHGDKRHYRVVERKAFGGAADE